MPKTFAMVNAKPHCIPELRRNLPLVDQPRLIAVKQLVDVDACHKQVLLFFNRIPHIENAFRQTLAGGGLSAPLWPFK